jgi:hypothetical protein
VPRVGQLLHAEVGHPPLEAARIVGEEGRVAPPPHHERRPLDPSAGAQRLAGAPRGGPVVGHRGAQRAGTRERRRVPRGVGVGERAGPQVHGAERGEEQPLASGAEHQLGHHRQLEGGHVPRAPHLPRRPQELGEAPRMRRVQDHQSVDDLGVPRPDVPRDRPAPVVPDHVRALGA